MKSFLKSLRVLFLFVFVCVLVSSASAMDSYEPDDSNDLAQVITTDGQVQSHSIDPAGDEDWVTFTVDSASAIVIETSGIGNDIDDDTVICLYDDQLNLIADDDDGGEDLFSRIETTVAGGTYYIRIHEYNDKRVLSEYFVSVVATAIEVLSVSPDMAWQGGSVAVTIIGEDATFFDGSSTVDGVWLAKGGATINATSYEGTDVNSLTASFDIPAGAEIGAWDVYVSDTFEGELAPLSGGFTVYTFPDIDPDGAVDVNDLSLLAMDWLGAGGVTDLDGDGIVNNHDFSLVSKHWLEGQTALPLGPSGMELVLIEGGTFLMGDHLGRVTNQTPVHSVTLSEFYISKYETTNGQYAEYLNAAMDAGDIKVDAGVVYASDDDVNAEPYFSTYSDSSLSQIEYSGGVFVVRSRDDDEGQTYSMTSFPVNEMSWYGAKAFCDHYGYQLPTEAQWEYASRGGYDDPYVDYPWGSDSISDNDCTYGWNNPLGLLEYPSLTYVGYHGEQGNYGLFDMAGNVSEWCNDWYSTYTSAAVTDPTGPATDIEGGGRILRGGGWNLPDYSCRVSARDKSDPSNNSHLRGFRVCYTVAVEE